MDIEYIANQHQFSIGLCFLLGTLHALEPGHGKTALVVHALAERGWRRPAIMALSTAFSHSVSILLIAGLVHGVFDFSIQKGQDLAFFRHLNLVSGMLLLAVSLWLFKNRNKSTLGHGSKCSCAHHRKVANLPLLTLTEFKQKKSFQTVILGLAIGLVPCPTALVALSQAIGVNSWLEITGIVMTFAAGIFFGIFALGSLMGLGVAPRLMSSKMFKGSGRAVGLFQVVVIGVTGMWHLYLGL